MRAAFKKPRAREKKWSRDPAPIGTIRVRNRRRADGKIVVPVRFIKVTHHGPKQKRWKPLARYTWEQTHGAVPKGQRVVHADGNTLHDVIGNYRLMTAGEVIALCHQLDARMSEENRRGHKRRSATAQHNRDRARVNRALGFMPTQWYAVDFERGVLFDPPRRSRSQVLRELGLIDGPRKNGSFKKGTLARWPVQVLRGSELAGAGHNVRDFTLRDLSEPICRVCGCSESDPCHDEETGHAPCWWVEGNLCSACAEKEIAA